MASQSLPVSRLVKVTVQLNPQAAQSPALNNMLVLGDSPVISITERWRLYESIEEVGNDFGDSAPEFLAAVLWFEQVPQPSQLYIGRWAKTATAGQLYGASLSTAQQAAILAAIPGDTYGFHIAIDGGASTEVDVALLNAQTNMNGVATQITAALTTATLGATAVWDAVNRRFVITSSTTGAASAVSFTTAGSTGSGKVDGNPLFGLRAADSGSFLSGGIIAETALAAVQVFDNILGQKFYGLTILDAVTADYLAIGSFIEAGSNYHFFGVSSQDQNILSAGSTTDVAAEMAALEFTRSAVQFSSTTAYAAVSLLARILTTDYTGQNTVITLMYKQEPGIVPEQLSSTQAAVLEAKNCNVFAEYNNDTAIIQDGVTCAGAPMFIDTQMIAVNYATSVQAAVYNRLFGANKVAQTDAGTHLIVTDIEAISSQFVGDGALAPGTWEGPGFGSLKTGDYMQKGYYVYAPPVATQNQADRSGRLSVPIQVAAKLAGAIHKVNIAITLDS